MPKLNPEIRVNPTVTTDTETEQGKKVRQEKKDANWQQIVDVHWGDLEFFVTKARNNKQAEDFDIAIKVLQSLKRQVVNENSKSKKSG